MEMKMKLYTLFNATNLFVFAVHGVWRWWLVGNIGDDGHVVAAICNMVAERSLPKPISLLGSQVVVAMAGFGTASILADPSLLIKGFDSIARFAMEKAPAGFRFTSGLSLLIIQFEKQTRNSGAQLHILAAKDRNEAIDTDSAKSVGVWTDHPKSLPFSQFLGNELSAIRIRESVSASQYACDTKSLSDMQRDIHMRITAALLPKACAIYRDLRMLLKSCHQQVTTAKELAYTWMSSRNILSLVEGLLDDSVAQVSKTTSAGQIDGVTFGKRKAQKHDVNNAFKAYFILCARNVSRSRAVGLPQTATATGFRFEETTDSVINPYFLMQKELIHLKCDARLKGMRHLSGSPYATQELPSASYQSQRALIYLDVFQKYSKFGGGTFGRQCSTSFKETTSAGQIDGATSVKQKAQTQDVDNAFKAYSVLCARNVSRSRSCVVLLMIELVLKKQKLCEEWVVANKQKGLIHLKCDTRLKGSPI
nr:hypothetical protein [Tanacetum cinerariifolium]